MGRAPQRDPNSASEQAPDGPATGTNGIQVIARAAAVLRVLKGSGSGSSLGQIARQIGLPRSTVQRIVNALLSEGLLMTAGPSGGYRLGPEIQSLARFGKIDIVEAVRPYTAVLSQETGETIDFSTLRGRQMLFLDQIPGNLRLRAVSAVGEVFPLIITANGKACLAQLDEPAAKVLIEGERERLKASHKIRSYEDICEELAEVRRTGIAYNLEEHTAGLSALGIGFADQNGSLYSISIPIPTVRFKTAKAELMRRLLMVRDEIQHKLGRR